MSLLKGNACDYGKSHHIFLKRNLAYCNCRILGLILADISFKIVLEVYLISRNYQISSALNSS